jgi:hypothetical protein
MGTHAIGLNRAIPCVGSPDGPMFACGAEGEISLLALADAAHVSGGGASEPVLVHVTVCRDHLREVRAWLRRMTPETIETFSTSMLLERWNVIEQDMPDVPVWRLQQAG